MTRKSGFATLDAVVQLVLCIDSSKLESKRKVITINAELTIIATRLTPNCRN